MLLTKTVSETINIYDGVINTVVESSDILNDFDLSVYDKLSVATESDNILIFVNVDIKDGEVSAYAVSPTNYYDYNMSDEEKENFIERMCKVVY